MKGAAGLVLLLIAASEAPGAGDETERRAIAYLSREVPRWSRENHCYSCHNNGDAARALYQAMALGRSIESGPLDDTTGWLARPETWDNNGGKGPFSDKRLARVQFTAALSAAVASNALKDRRPLERAALRLVADQASDGSWPIDDAGQTVGAPTSYHRPLATLMARDSLRAAAGKEFEVAIFRADRWLLDRPVENVFDASVMLLALSGRRDFDDGTVALRSRALVLLRQGQGGDGGWGPFVQSAPEPFDTALALLALIRIDREPTDSVRAMIQRGRAYLAATQEPDGSWPETTRPAGAESYAQRISTSGWATLALLATADLER